MSDKSFLTAPEKCNAKALEYYQKRLDFGI
jgi:hypothetical protein